MNDIIERIQFHSVWGADEKRTNKMGHARYGAITVFLGHLNSFHNPFSVQCIAFNDMCTLIFQRLATANIAGEKGY